jgi:hypothetical protein
VLGIDRQREHVRARAEVCGIHAHRERIRVLVDGGGHGRRWRGRRAGNGAQPYVRTGLGLHVYRYDPGSIDTNASTLARPGASLGAGLHFVLPAFSAFIGGRFVGDHERGFVALQGGIAYPIP